MLLAVAVKQDTPLCIATVCGILVYRMVVQAPFDEITERQNIGSQVSEHIVFMYRGHESPVMTENCLVSLPVASL